jgi:hypothetical protein
LFRQGASLVVGSAVVALPFMVLIGGVSLKQSMKYMIEAKGWDLPDRSDATPRVGHVHSALPLAKWKYGAGITPDDRDLWAARALVEMVDKLFFHVFLYPALAALWLFRRRFAEVPGMWVLFLSGVVLLPLLYKLGKANGYISERHVIILLLGGVPWSAAGLGVLAGWLAKRTPRVSAPVLSLVVLLAFAGACLPRTMARLHGNRDGFREVGAWIAENTNPGDKVVDPMSWSYYHSGRVFVEGQSDVPRSDPPVSYVVLEESKSTHAHIYYLLDPAKALAKRGKVCHSLTVHRGRDTAKIEVFRVEGVP